jgi:hypothetical protein
VPWSFIQDGIEIPAHRGTEPESEKAYDLVTSWYATCRLEHDVCNTRKHTEGPRRLLYIGQESTGPSDTIRLVECDVNAPPDFIALSHSWGPGEHKPVKTIRNNIEKHKIGIETAALSRTFRDAVAVGRRLGEKYLWIDSLCTVQDDDQDTAREILRMPAIYEGAQLTTAVAVAGYPGTEFLTYPWRMGDQSGLRSIGLSSWDSNVRLSSHRKNIQIWTHSTHWQQGNGHCRNVYSADAYFISQPRT